MYIFEKYQFDWLNVYVARPSVGDVWKKQFVSGVTPLNQFSLNVYTAGRFKITTETTDFSQVLGVGDSSLDIALAEFPTDGLVLETPIDAPACRMCFSVNGGGKWNRTKHSVKKGQTLEIRGGEIAFVLPLSGWDGQGVPDIRMGTPVVAKDDCFIFLLSKQNQ